MASSTVALATPFLVRMVIDEALPHQDVRLLVLAVAGMLAVTVVTAVFGVVQTWLSTTVGQRVMHGLRTAVFTHLQRQSLGFFTRTKGGEVQSRLMNDIGGMQSVVTSTATSAASNATTVIGTAVAMAALSWRLSLLSLVVLPPAIWLTRRVARMRRTITAQRQRHLADLHSQVEEGLSVSGVLLGKTLGAGPAQSQRFTGTSDDLVALEVRSQLAGRWRMATMSIVFAGIPALIYLAAGPAGDLRRHDDRHAGRLHRPAGRALPAADGPARPRRHADQLDGAVQPGVRVPRPARRHRRPGVTRCPSTRRRCAARSASSTSASATPTAPGRR